MKKNSSWRKIFVFVLALVTVLSVTMPALAEGFSWFGNHANGSASTGTATGGYSIIFNTAEQCVVGYRFALIRKNGNYVTSTSKSVQDVFFDKYSDYITSRYRGLAKNYYYPFSRSMYYYEDSQDGEDGWERTEIQTAKRDSNAVKESSCGFNTSLPRGDVDYASQFATWGANAYNAEAISKLLGSNYTTVKNNKYTITVEPIFAFTVNKVPVAWTVADIAQWGNVYFGSKVVPSGGDGTFGYIANKTNKDFPNLIYVSDSSVLGSWAWSASALTSKANFYTLSNYAYGTGVLYANGKTPSGGGTTSTSYTITYDANGGTLSGSKTQSYTKTTNVTLQGKPTKDGYDFAGWKPNYNASNSWDSTKKYAAGANCGTGNYGDVTMVAQWTSKSYNYTVYHYLQNTDGTYSLNSTATGSASYGASVTGTVKSFTGFTSPSAQTITIGTGSNVIYYYYPRNKYTVTLYKGTGISSVSGGGTYYYGATVTINATASTGYTWSKWSGTYNTTTKQYSFTMPAANVTETAYANINSYNYTVNYYLQNVSGSGYTLNSSTSGSANYGSSVTGPLKSFTGFTTPSAQTITIGTGSNVINYYYKRNTYYLDLNGWLDGVSSGNISGYGTADVYINGSLVANDVTDYYTAWPYGTTYEIKDIRSTTGHTYNGVYSGSIKGTITGTTGVALNLTTNKVRIAYHPNGGSVSVSGYGYNDYGWVTQNGVTYFHALSYGSSDDPYNASSFGLTRPGYTFGGWKMDPNGTVLDQDTVYSSTTYVDHTNASKTTANTSLVTCYLYAIWIPTYDVEITDISFKYIDSSGNTQTVTDMNNMVYGTKYYVFYTYRNNSLHSVTADCYGSGKKLLATRTFAAGESVTLRGGSFTPGIGDGILSGYIYMNGYNFGDTSGEYNGSNNSKTVSFKTKFDIELKEIYLADKDGNRLDPNKIFTQQQVYIHHVYKNNSGGSVTVNGYHQGNAITVNGSTTFTLAANETKDVVVKIHTPTKAEDITITGSIYRNGKNASTEKYENNLSNNTKSLTIKVLALPYLEPIQPNQGYRQGTEVITSYYVHNDSEIVYNPRNGIAVTMNVYNKDTGELITTQKQSVYVPANETQLIWFKWSVPEDATSSFRIKATIVANGVEGILVDKVYSLALNDEKNTEDTEFEKAPPSWWSYNSPEGDYNVSSKWSTWEWEDGTFVKKKYGINFTSGTATITPFRSPTAVLKDGIWCIRSGYGFTLSMESATIARAAGSYSFPAVSAYTMPQYVYARYPEFQYKAIAYDGACGETTMEKVGTTWQLPDYLDYNGRCHFTPLWYPDGKYTVTVISDDIWTPMGCYHIQTSTTLKISGSVYDDWYIS